MWIFFMVTLKLEMQYEICNWGMVSAASWHGVKSGCDQQCALLKARWAGQETKGYTLSLKITEWTEVHDSFLLSRAVQHSALK